MSELRLLASETFLRWAVWIAPHPQNYRIAKLVYDYWKQQGVDLRDRQQSSTNGGE